MHARDFNGKMKNTPSLQRFTSLIMRPRPSLPPSRHNIHVRLDDGATDCPHAHCAALRLFSCDGYRTRTVVSVFDETTRDADGAGPPSRFSAQPETVTTADQITRGRPASRFGSALFCTSHNVEEAQGNGESICRTLESRPVSRKNCRKSRSERRFY